MEYGRFKSDESFRIALDVGVENFRRYVAPPLITALADQVNLSSPGRAFRFIAGVSRLALETRPNLSNACIACGECMIGCPRGSMHSTVAIMEAWRRSGLIARVVSGRALAIDRQTRSVTTETDDGRLETVGPFDRIYVCAGCLGTTEITMRTLQVRDGLRIVDNSVYTFLIIYRGSPLARLDDQQRYFGLTNLLINAIPLTSDKRHAQLQIYLIFDHLWRYFVPFALWPLIAPLGRAVRRRVLLARIFLHCDHSQTYAVRVEGNRPATLSLAHPGTPLLRVPGLWSDIRRCFDGGLFVLPFRPMRQTTSSPSLSIEEGPVAMDASIGPGIYLCDSSVFPTAPASSPTFTIMANARRIADLSLRS